MAQRETGCPSTVARTPRLNPAGREVQGLAQSRHVEHAHAPALTAAKTATKTERLGAASSARACTRRRTNGGVGWGRDGRDGLQAMQTRERREVVRVVLVAEVRTDAERIVRRRRGECEVEHDAASCVEQVDVDVAQEKQHVIRARLAARNAQSGGGQGQEGGVHVGRERISSRWGLGQLKTAVYAPPRAP